MIKSKKAPRLAHMPFCDLSSVNTLVTKLFVLQLTWYFLLSQPPNYNFNLNPNKKDLKLATKLWANLETFFEFWF